MGNPIKRAASGTQVSTWADPDDGVTPLNQSSFLNPYGLTLRQTITSSGSVTIPAGFEWVYVVAVGGGGSPVSYAGANGGSVAWGWTPAASICIVGAGSSGNLGGYTRFGNVIAVGGQPLLAATNYWGMPSAGGTSASTGNGVVGATGQQGSSSTATNGVGGNGGDGITGGGGGYVGYSGSGTATGGNGGSGLVGGGGGGTFSNTGTRTGGNGGNGRGIDGTTYTGGTGSTGTNTNGAGGGGAGVAGNGSNASGTTGGNGGLGGGGGGSPNGVGGSGILYIFY